MENLIDKMIMYERSLNKSCFLMFSLTDPHTGLSSLA